MSKRIVLTLSLIVFGGCFTEDVSRDSFPVQTSNDGSSGLGGLTVSYIPQGSMATVHLGIDGKPAVIMPDAEYRLILPHTSTAVFVKSGAHIASLLDDGGNTLVVSGAVEVKENEETHVVFYGAPNALSFRAFTPDLPAYAGQGKYLLRGINVMQSGESIDVVQCTTSTPTTADACTTLVPALAYGQLFEQAISPSATELGVRYSPCVRANDNLCEMIDPWRSASSQRPKVVLFADRWRYFTYPDNL
jgi:hypothetical protein